MKVRSGFVSNSSSSSFVIAAKNKKDLKTKITIEVNFADFIEDSGIKTIEDLDEYFEEEYDEGFQKLAKYKAAKKAIEEGKTLYCGRLHSDGDNSIELLLQDGFKKYLGKEAIEKIEVIEDSEGY